MHPSEPITDTEADRHQIPLGNAPARAQEQPPLPPKPPSPNPSVTSKDASSRRKSRPKRPAHENRVELTTYVSKADKENIVARATRRSLSVSEYLSRRALRAPLPPVPVLMATCDQSTRTDIVNTLRLLDAATRTIRDAQAILTDEDTQALLDNFKGIRQDLHAILTRLWDQRR